MRRSCPHVSAHGHGAQAGPPVRPALTTLPRPPSLLGSSCWIVTLHTCTCTPAHLQTQRTCTPDHPKRGTPCRSIRRVRSPPASRLPPCCSPWPGPATQRAPPWRRNPRHCPRPSWRRAARSTRRSSKRTCASWPTTLWKDGEPVRVAMTRRRSTSPSRCSRSASCPAAWAATSSPCRSCAPTCVPRCPRSNSSAAPRA